MLALTAFLAATQLPEEVTFFTPADPAYQREWPWFWVLVVFAVVIGVFLLWAARRPPRRV